MKKRKRKVFKPKKKIAINLDGWELGDWPDDVAKCVEVEVEHYYDEIEINLRLHTNAFQDTARKIAAEAIETYWHELSFFWNERGLRLYSEGEELNQKVVIPWDSVMFDWLPKSEMPAAVTAAEQWLAAQKKEIDEEYADPNNELDDESPVLPPSQ